MINLVGTLLVDNDGDGVAVGRELSRLIHNWCVVHRQTYMVNVKAKTMKVPDKILAEDQIAPFIEEHRLS